MIPIIQLTLLLGFFFFSMPLPMDVAAQPWQICGTTNYKANSTYQSNLDSLSSSLITQDGNPSSGQFGKASRGAVPDTVYAVALCRGDIASFAACSDCVDAAFKGARQLCGLSKDATVFYDDCLLRYSDMNILNMDVFDQVNTSAVVDGALILMNITSVPMISGWENTNFTQFFQKVMSDMVAHALSTTRLYAAIRVDNMDDTSSSTLPRRLFCLAQCAPDLIEDICFNCLTNFSNLATANFSGRQGGRVLGLRCNLRYDTQKFFAGKMNAQEDEALIYGLQATSNFSEENKLGQGGFGPVYKVRGEKKTQGRFPDGVEIAVKRLASHSGQGLTEFKNEIQLIAKLQHTNLVRLLGCCYQGQEKILIYEYLPNKSLDFFIFDETRRALVDWHKRLAIIDGIAQGLLYLHKHSRLRVIHRDLKAGNILLDGEMNPKIADFGLAKIFGTNDNEGNTKRIVGTYGYMAPEYASEGHFSTKSDVFSFGVLIIEIVSGKRTSSFHRYGEFINLLGHAWQMWKDETWFRLVDPSLATESHKLEIMRCINIALLCVQENAADRPTTSEVVAMLSNKTMNLPEPKHPAFFNMRLTNEEASTVVVASSVNGITLSAVDGR
uniref:Uncharacterized protein n=1 Tax=Leersia perrieri TaxID=77586 RepID=A0A0D9XVB8_9ORYZ